MDKKKVCGPTRKTRAEAEKDSRRLTESEHHNTVELQSAVERLHQEVAEVGADMDQEVAEVGADMDQEVADMDEEGHGANAGRHAAD